MAIIVKDRPHKIPREIIYCIYGNCRIASPRKTWEQHKRRGNFSLYHCPICDGAYEEHELMIFTKEKLKTNAVPTSNLSKPQL